MKMYLLFDDGGDALPRVTSHEDIERKLAEEGHEAYILEVDAVKRYKLVKATKLVVDRV